MTDLSLAARAVLDAMHRSYDHEPTRRALAAGVLRAAVDQVIGDPNDFAHMPNESDWRAGFADATLRICDELLTLATELESVQ